MFLIYGIVLSEGLCKLKEVLNTVYCKREKINFIEILYEEGPRCGRIEDVT